MTDVKNGTKEAPHGLFHMENAGGHPQPAAKPTPAAAAEEHQPGCFALEEEKGKNWKGAGASEPVLKEKRPTL